MILASIALLALSKFKTTAVKTNNPQTTEADKIFIDLNNDGNREYIILGVPETKDVNYPKSLKA